MLIIKKWGSPFPDPKFRLPGEKILRILVHILVETGSFAIWEEGKQMDKIQAWHEKIFFLKKAIEFMSDMYASL